VSEVLLVEDDTLLRMAVSASLVSEQLDVQIAGSGEAAVVIVEDAPPEVVVLDLGLPGMDGLETLRRIRVLSDIPVVVLTVRDRLADKVAALDAGADDFMVKPFDPPELLARLRAQLRRGRAHRTEARVAVHRYGRLEIDLGRRRVTWDGESVVLTRIEYRLLEVLLVNRGRLLTREEIFREVWGATPSPGRARLSVAMSHLRRKLHDDAARPRLIFTEPGLGYRWNPDSDADPGPDAETTTED
jgi:two-component system, OmpR family, KDP operon response regulator KdpE